MTDSREANAPAQNDPRQLFDFDLADVPMDRLIANRDTFQIGATNRVGDTKRRCQAQVDRYQAEIDRRTDGSRG